MSIAWMTPAALIGVTLVALPIAIHLLVRQHARTVAFPSLRFLRETQLAAFRRRRIQDAALLACRVAIIAAAAVALAGPIVQTAARTAGYASRVSRAIVAVEGSEDRVIANEASGALRSTTIRRETIADALAEATRWLDRQPPSAREIVVVGALRRGAVAGSDLVRVPGDVGIRFDAATVSSPADITWPVLTRRNGGVVRIDRRVHLDVDATRVSDGVVVPLGANPIAIIAAAPDTPLAEAALNAVLDAGVPWTDHDRRVLIAWTGADESALRVAANTDIIRMPVPSPASSAADAVMSALEASRPTAAEPVAIAAEQLAAWTRPPGAPSSDAPMNDEGDRRWLWALALALLGLEAWLRRDRAQAAAPAVDGRDTEARVA